MAKMERAVKLPVEVLRQLGALAEVSDILRDEIKEISKAAKDRAKEILAEGGDATADPGVRELERRSALLRSKQEENKRDREKQDAHLWGNIERLDQKIESIIGVRGITASAMSHFAGKSPLAGMVGMAANAGTFAQRAALQLAQSGMISGSTALSVAGAGAAVGTAAAMAAIPLAAIGAIVGASQLWSKYNAQALAAAQASSAVAAQVLDMVTQGGSPNRFETDFLRDTIASMGAAQTLHKASAYANTNIFSKAGSWLFNATPTGVEEAGARGATHAQRLAEMGRVMGKTWSNNVAFADINRKAEFDDIFRKILEREYGVEGVGQALRLFGDMLAAGSLTGPIDAAHNEAIIQQQERLMNTANTERALISQPGGKGGLGHRSKVYADTKMRMLQLDAGVSREYFTSQQWNTF